MDYRDKENTEAYRKADFSVIIPLEVVLLKEKVIMAAQEFIIAETSGILVGLEDKKLEVPPEKLEGIRQAVLEYLIAKRENKMR